MAHYAFLNQNNIVTEVIVGKDETDTTHDWEEFYGNLRGQTCKRALRAKGVQLAHARTPREWNRASPTASEAHSGPAAVTPANTSHSQRRSICSWYPAPRHPRHCTRMRRGHGAGQRGVAAHRERSAPAGPAPCARTHALPRASAPCCATRRREQVRAHLRLLTAEASHGWDGWIRLLSSCYGLPRTTIIHTFK